MIWAVDAFEPDLQFHRPVVAALKRLVRRDPSLEIEPVYILNSSQLNLPGEFMLGETAQVAMGRYRPAAERALMDLCERLEVPQLSAPQVLLQALGSTSHAVRTLANYAQRSGASMIVAASHGRKGMRRAVLGSFVEALLLVSEVPVLAIEPRTRRDYHFDDILFATDFGRHSELVFRQVVALAGLLHANLTIYHAIPNPIEPVFQAGVYLLGGNWVPVHAYFTQEIARHRRHGVSWVRWARKQGVNADVVIESRTVNIAESIVRHAQAKHFGLIAMEAQSGPIASAILGSTARQVIRTADCPVWIMRSPKRRRTEKRERTLRPAA